MPAVPQAPTPSESHRGVVEMHVRQSYSRWRRYRAVARELDSYSRRELAELGIAPQDIGRVAWAASDRRR